MKIKLFTLLLLICMANTVCAQNKITRKPTTQQAKAKPKPKPQPSPAKPASKPQQKVTNPSPAKENLQVTYLNGYLTIRGAGFEYKMIQVKGGTFMMGATSEQKDPYDNEKPVHQVTLSDYYIGETEVTQALWKAVMGNNPSHFKGDNLPVEQVSWEDCQDFIARLNQKTNIDFCLPTEAQWEYAARGGNLSRGTQYSGAYSLDNCGWYDGNSINSTHSVKTKQANELGIYDMSGNVWEWCQDRYDSYSSDSQSSPKGSGAYSEYVGRGGGWDSIAGNCRLARRSYAKQNDSDKDAGFRIALNIIVLY